jgi:trimeric autotransporter adhesin
MAHRLIAFVLAAAVLGAAGCTNMKSNRLSLIFVTPENPVIAKGTNAQLLVTAIFSNGVSLLAWSQVTWQTSDPLIATVSATGMVTGVSSGTVTITAVDNGHPDVTRSITAIITETPLQEIALDPVFTTITGTAQQQQFAATGIFTASTWTLDMTSRAFWFSSNPAIAFVSNATGSSGIVTSIALGTASIGARDPVSGITGTTMIAVIPSPLVSLTVEPATVSIPTGSAQQFSATGTFTSTGLTLDLTQVAVWSSSSPSIAQVSNTPGAKGLVSSLAPGTTEISARDLRSGITGTAVLTVL